MRISPTASSQGRAATKAPTFVRASEIMKQTSRAGQGASSQRSGGWCEGGHHHNQCHAAAEADRKVEMLGNEVVNPLEKRVTDLEDLDLEHRVNGLLQRLRPYEDYKTLVEDQVAKLRQTEQALRSKKDELELPIRSEMQTQKDALEALARKVQMLQERLGLQGSDDWQEKDMPGLTTLTSRIDQLESRKPSSASEANSLALDLLNRLQDGDILHPIVVRQLALFLTGRRQSATSEDSKHSPVPPNARKSAAENQTTGAVTKRRGRPLKHGKYARKATADEIRQLVAGPERRESNASGFSIDSPPRTPLKDLPSVERAALAAASKSKGPARRMELPGTQLKDDGVPMQIQNHVPDDSDEAPFIPGERKSGRTPKPRRFEDQVDWKQANKVLRR